MKTIDLTWTSLPDTNNYFMVKVFKIVFFPILMFGVNGVISLDIAA